MQYAVCMQSALCSSVTDIRTCRWMCLHLAEYVIVYIWRAAPRGSSLPPGPRYCQNLPLFIFEIWGSEIRAMLVIGLKWTSHKPSQGPRIIDRLLPCPEATLDHVYRYRYRYGASLYFERFEFHNRFDHHGCSWWLLVTWIYEYVCS